MDVFYAANKVGPNGEVTGIDMTDEQLAKSRKLAKEYGYDNIYFIESYIESLPLRSGSIDVVISNGVINLSASKESVFAEVARILRPGGRLAISDIVSEIPLPENISCNASLWAACIGGALQIDRYKKIIEDNGLSIVETKTNPYAFLSKGAKGATKDYGISSISILAIKQ
jgi:arsenite methyltransferase